MPLHPRAIRSHLLGLLPQHPLSERQLLAELDNLNAQVSAGASQGNNQSDHQPLTRCQAGRASPKITLVGLLARTLLDVFTVVVAVLHAHAAMVAGHSTHQPWTWGLCTPIPPAPTSGAPVRFPVSG